MDDAIGSELPGRPQRSIRVREISRLHPILAQKVRDRLAVENYEATGQPAERVGERARCQSAIYGLSSRWKNPRSKGWDSAGGGSAGGEAQRPARPGHPFAPERAAAIPLWRTVLHVRAELGRTKRRSRPSRTHAECTSNAGRDTWMMLLDAAVGKNVKTVERAAPLEHV